MSVNGIMGRVGMKEVQTMKQSIQAVIFDMDGLMLDTERIAREAWRFAFNQFGIALTDEDYLHFLGISPKDVSNMVAQRYSEKVDFDRAYQIRLDYTEQYYKEHGVPLKPGIVELLSFLESNGIQRVVATSSTGDMARFRLQRAGILDWFAYISSSDQVGRGKPAPDVYLAALEHLKISRDMCVALEDSEAGIRAALAADLRVIWVPDLIEPSPLLRERVWTVVNDLNEASDFLRSCLQAKEVMRCTD